MNRIKMVQFPDITILTNISGNAKNVNKIFQALLLQFEEYLNMKIKSNRVQISMTSEQINGIGIFNYGTININQNNLKLIKISSEFIKFLPFIILRELFNCFVDKSLLNNISINMTINQMVLVILSKNPHINEWKSLIRAKFEQEVEDLVSGIRYISHFDRLNRFFNFYSLDLTPNSIQFFFQYLNEHPGLAKSKSIDFNYILFKNYRENLTDLLKTNQMAESIYSIIKIFYRVRKYSNLLEYKNYFASFKKRDLLQTNLSLRKFTECMDLIKKNFISPSYQINWNALDIGVILIKLKFNPIIPQSKIDQVLKDLPFLISPKKSVNCFSADYFGYLVLPSKYLNDSFELLKSLKKEKFLLDYEFLIRISQTHILNLNYFKEEFSNKVIPNPNFRNYDNRYIIKAHTEYGEQFFKYPLSILDFLILDRIRWFSTSGLGFERNQESISFLKADLFGEINSQRSFLTKFKNLIKKIYINEDLRNEVVNLIKNYEDLGFFNVRYKINSLLEFINSIAHSRLYEKVHSTGEIRKFLRDFVNSVEMILKYKRYLEEFELKNLLEIYFDSKEKYKMKSLEIEYTSDLLNICSSLNIFSLNWLLKILTNETIVNKLIITKQRVLRDIFEEFQIKDFNTKFLSNNLDKFIENNPPIIFPSLINTISNNVENDYFQALIKDFPQFFEISSTLNSIFPRTLITKVKNLNSNEIFYYLEFSLPPLKRNEKKQFVSIFFNLFNQNIIYGKNHIWSGFINLFSVKNFYDYEKRDFYYTKDLYNEYLKYVKENLEIQNSVSQIVKFENQEIFWSDSSDLIEFINKVNKRKAQEQTHFNQNQIEMLTKLYKNLEETLLDIKAFILNKNHSFFKSYIKAIKFFPAFQRFGLSEIISYFHFNDLNQVKFKSFIKLNFLEIEYPASIDKSIPFLIRSVSSYRKPPELMDLVSVLKNAINEFFIANINKSYLLFHFKMNFTPEGWDYNSISFREHYENLFFNDKHSFKVPNLKEFKFIQNENLKLFGLDSQEFFDLCKVYSYKPLDIKSILGTKKRKTIERIQKLLRKGLIYPYISLKNLGFNEYIYIILPDLKYNLLDKLVEIFGWFNYGVIHEIDGKYFINGFTNPKTFDSGLIIKLYFPKCELVEFIQEFEMIFEYLDIEHYLILKDFVKGNTLVKNLYNDLNFFDHYHPLRNVKYEGKDDNK